MTTSCRDLLSVASLFFLIMISGCGSGGDKARTTDEVVSVTPPAATVSAGGQVTLQATVSGCGSACPTPAFTWGIGELQVNGATGAQCNWQDNAPPPGPCPYGTIEGPNAPLSDTVTFHAPSTSGMIHVLAQVTQLSNPPNTKTGTAVITVP